ncbi:YitT family protein [Carnobacterium gallinarum]|uniref:YitT family protein n=1 Tax=Carnobacterium gallinarum TaxID=2749 RepID=UPI00054F46C5|nr:YitT family protein [Carnobacterium gallinarum]
MTKKKIANYLKIILGAFIFSVAVNMFALPNELGEGGVTGLTMMLYYQLSWSPALTNLLFNSVLLVIGYKYLDKSTVFLTIFAVALMSFFLRVTTVFVFKPDEVIVAALAAGALMGAGMGLIMLGGGTTAGSAILAKLANKYLGWNTSYALLFFDLIVVLPSVFIIGLEKMLFTVVSLYISTKVLDFILEGFNPKKSVTIISDKYEQIAQDIDEQLERGITIFHGQGYYLKQDRKILYTVVNRQQLLQLTKIVNQYDPKAFFIINDVQRVVGEGFTKQATSE